MKVFVLSYILMLAPLVGRADLFVDDHVTRTVMTENERHLPVVQVAKSSGILLGESLLLTAQHTTKNWQSYSYQGATMFYGPHNDHYYFKFESIIEEDAALDYAIVRISWKNGVIPPGLQWVKSIVMPGEIKLGVIHTMDIFTLGSPWDKIPNPMKSSGSKIVILPDSQIKYPLLFNAGVIEGNSGGPIFTADGKLLGIVTGGPHKLGEPGWEGNDPNKIESWNWGTPIQNIFKISKVLQELFPRGE
jgi:hypothetical protein